MSRKVIVNDRFQQGYTYVCTAEPGQDFHPEFRPDLTPKQMLAMGVFGGCYLTDCRDEFPGDWFETARLSPGKPDSSLNFYQVKASQPLSLWRAKGWIYPDDPRGWFQWYCRYYLGRRLPEEDLRQIGRWKAIKRHAGAIRKHCRPGPAPGQALCRPKQRQALLHWAYDPRSL